MRGRHAALAAVVVLPLTLAGCGSDTKAEGSGADACALISRSTVADVLGSKVEGTKDSSKDLGGVGSNVLDCTWSGAEKGHTLVLTAYAEKQSGSSGPVLGVPGVTGVLDLPSSRSPFAADLKAGWGDYRIRLGVATNGEEPDEATLRPALKKAVTEVKANLSEKDFEFQDQGS